MKADLMALLELTDLSSKAERKTTADKIPIYRCSGEYFGFIYYDNLFDATSNYLGWVEKDGLVWRSNGLFLGRLVDDNYILKHTDSVAPAPKVPPIPPASPIPPFPCPNRLGRTFPFGWLDALEGS
jgi:hypothetical protein